MDHEELLKKYIAHIIEYEGTSYMDTLNASAASEVEFTLEELTELERLIDEVDP